jgi:hypothetical protein
MSGVTQRRRRVVISEGERDTTFLEAVVDHYANQYDVKCIDIGSEPADALYRRESNELAKFDAMRVDDVLLKSEGGRPNLEKVFPRLVGDLNKIDAELTLLFDLDGDDLSTFVDTVREKLEGRTAGRETRLSPSSDLDRYHHLVAREFSLSVDGRHVVDLGLLAFHDSLEAVADIDKERDSRETMDEKVRNLVHDEKIREPVVRTIF